MTNYYVYIVQCADDTLYTGYTTDVEKRVTEHNGTGETKASKMASARYTRARRPVTLVYSEEQPSRSAAMKCEAAIKKLSRGEKLRLIENK